LQPKGQLRGSWCRVSREVPRLLRVVAQDTNPGWGGRETPRRDAPRDKHASSRAWRGPSSLCSSGQISSSEMERGSSSLCSSGQISSSEMKRGPSSLHSSGQISSSEIWLTIIGTPLPGFFVSVDSKGRRLAVSGLGSTLAEGLGSVDSKGVEGDIIGRGNLGWEASGRVADRKVWCDEDTGKVNMDLY
jgi:hypothetical protein